MDGAAIFSEYINPAAFFYYYYTSDKQPKKGGEMMGSLK
jgi:hypothetical protein